VHGVPREAVAAVRHQARPAGRAPGGEAPGTVDGDVHCRAGHRGGRRSRHSRRQGIHRRAAPGGEGGGAQAEGLGKREKGKLRRIGRIGPFLFVYFSPCLVRRVEPFNLEVCLYSVKDSEATIQNLVGHLSTGAASYALALLPHSPVTVLRVSPAAAWLCSSAWPGCSGGCPPLPRPRSAAAPPGPCRPPARWWPPGAGSGGGPHSPPCGSRGRRAHAAPPPAARDTRRSATSRDCFDPHSSHEASLQALLQLLVPYGTVCDTAVKTVTCKTAKETGRR
jgi:hypothetical protein